MAKKIAVIVGSLRKESYNRKIANELIRLADGKLNLQIVEIGNLPLYNEDSDQNPPQ
jgi:chromate reductase